MVSTMRAAFLNREAAGRALAARLLALRLSDAVVFALPRGGVPVAIEVAHALHAPLDLLLVRKIGAPGNPELAIAAVADGNELVIDEFTRQASGTSFEYIEDQARTEMDEIRRRRKLYLHGRAPLPVEGRTAIVVDDGIATGTTVRAALTALRRRSPAKIVLAVPLAPAEALAELRGHADRIECLVTPSPFFAVGSHYVDFAQVADDEVIAQLAAFEAEASRGQPR
jgi:putative phosphoribosyl transferase